MQITKGCATCNPNFVATAADGHNTENPNPVKNHNQPVDFECCFCVPCFNDKFFALQKYV